MNRILIILLAFLYSVATAGTKQTAISAKQDKQKVIAYGTDIDPDEQMKESQRLARELAKPGSPGWRKKGDQHRTYHFADANAEMPYRLYVPSGWDGKTKLPLVMFLHGAWSDENTYVDANNKLMIDLAEKNGFILVSPLGYNKLGAYGTCLRLPAVFGKPEEAAKLMAAVTEETTQTLKRSERDVINVLELVLNEYPVDPNSVFLMGHSMGSGGTWYLGAKYNKYWKAIAPLSGPFVDEKLYPWDRIKNIPVFITEGTRAASIESSRILSGWLGKKGFKTEYKEVEADHPGMVPLLLPEVFSFFRKYAIK